MAKIIDTNGLMIGNWVIVLDKNDEKEKAFVKISDLDIKNINRGIGPFNYKPIIITKEILIKNCQFELSKSSSNKFNIQDFSYNIWNKMAYLCESELINYDLEYLHELQNLYYCISKKSLKINF